MSLLRQFLSPSAMSAQCHRHMVVVTGAEAACIRVAEELSALPTGRWFGRGDDAAKPLALAKQQLGSSLDWVVVNAFDGFHPNAIAAISGCVRGGGLLVWLLPRLGDWPAYDCPDYQRLAVEGYTVAPDKRFIRRCAQLLAADSKAIHIDAESPQIQSNQSLSISPVSVSANFVEQQQAVAAIQRVAQGHRKRPLVITAARGRGKSASLGIAAKALISEGLSVLLVAPNKLAVAEVVKFAGGESPSLRFMPPDAVTEALPTADIVLVDEAAAIPVPMLVMWAQRYPRIVFSSTTFGYEGHGQGFARRFLPALAEHCPQYRTLELTQPIRWAQNCPVEALINQLFLLAPSTEAKVEWQDGDHEISQRELLDSPQLLTAVYALLLSAHYQTTPDDLRTLLDGPNIRLFVSIRQASVVAIAMVAEEGELAPQLHADIFAAKRRVRGHVAPQFLTANGIEEAWLGLSSWRIVRIAVAEDRRRQGLASRLLDCVSAAANQQQVSALTSVFGWTPSLLAFWRENDFTPLACSTKRDSVSATLAGAIVKPLTNDAKVLVDEQRLCFQQALTLLLPGELQWIDVDLLRQLMMALPKPLVLTDQERRALHAFVNGHKPLNSVLVIIARCLWSFTSEGDNPAWRALAQKCYFGGATAACCAVAGFTGEKQFVAAARGWVGSQLVRMDGSVA